MSRRLAIFFISLLIGLGSAGLARGFRAESQPAVSEQEPKPVKMKKEKVPENRILVLAGVTPVNGPGIRITVEDSLVRNWSDEDTERLIVHERDLMLIVNELFSAGAEAISINGNRLIATTEIRCVGPAIRINGRNNTPPYVIDAIGDPQTLKDTVLMIGGVVDVLALERLVVEVEATDAMTVPAYREKEDLGTAVKEEGAK